MLVNHQEVRGTFILAIRTSAILALLTLSDEWRVIVVLLLYCGQSECCDERGGNTVKHWLAQSHQTRNVTCQLWRGVGAACFIKSTD